MLMWVWENKIFLNYHLIILLNKLKNFVHFLIFYIFSYHSIRFLKKFLIKIKNKSIKYILNRIKKRSSSSSSFIYSNSILQNFIYNTLFCIIQKYMLIYLSILQEFFYNNKQILLFLFVLFLLISYFTIKIHNIIIKSFV